MGTQMESRFVCPTCKGAEDVVLGPDCDCGCRGKIHGLVLEACPDCYEGRIPCEFCGDRPASAVLTWEHGPDEIVCSTCYQRANDGPPDGECGLGMSEADMWESQAQARLLK